MLVSGAFAGFRSDVARAVGGFDTDCLVEDYELIHRIHRYGSVMGPPGGYGLSAMRAAHRCAPPIGSFLRQRRRWFGGFLQTQYWYRDLVGARATVGSASP